jgi:hypothetical protein
MPSPKQKNKNVQKLCRRWCIQNGAWPKWVHSICDEAHKDQSNTDVHSFEVHLILDLGTFNYYLYVSSPNTTGNPSNWCARIKRILTCDTMNEYFLNGRVWVTCNQWIELYWHNHQYYDKDNSFNPPSFEKLQEASNMTLLQAIKMLYQFHKE